jgi:hypothetical protein
MLPDFAAMLRVRPPHTLSAALSAGVQFHHATDRVFHEATAFLEISRTAFRWLSEHGLGKGGARAVAHIGVEILLDGALATADEPGAEAYLRALEHASDARVSGQIAWDVPTAARFVNLCHTLLARGVSREEPAAELVAARVRRALDGRPRLALDDAGQSVVRDWVTLARASIVARAPGIIFELEQRLSP